MGSVTEQFITQIRGAATIMGGVQEDAVTDAAKAAKLIMEGAVTSMVGPDGRMHNNVTRSGSPKGGIKVRYDVAKSGVGAPSPGSRRRDRSPSSSTAHRRMTSSPVDHAGAASGAPCTPAATTIRPRR